MSEEDKREEKLRKLGYSKQSLIGFAVFIVILIVGLFMRSK